MFTFDNSGSGGGGTGFSPQFIGSLVTPYEVDPIIGIDINSIINTSFQIIAYIKSTGGAINISANPQITNGYAEGQRLLLIGMSDTDTVQIDDGDGLILNGNRILELYNTIELYWTGVQWLQINQNM